MVLPSSLPKLKKVTSRQSGSLCTVPPLGQSPSAGYSVAATVREKGAFTCANPSVNSCAFGSIMQELGPFGQKMAGFVTLVPGSNCKVTGVSCCGTKFAVTFNAEFIVKLHVGLVPELAHAPPQPAKVEGEVAAAVRVTCVP